MRLLAICFETFLRFQPHCCSILNPPILDIKFDPNQIFLPLGVEETTLVRPDLLISTNKLTNALAA